MRGYLPRKLQLRQTEGFELRLLLRRRGDGEEVLETNTWPRRADLSNELRITAN